MNTLEVMLLSLSLQYKLNITCVDSDVNLEMGSFYRRVITLFTLKRLDS